MKDSTTEKPFKTRLPDVEPGKSLYVDTEATRALTGVYAAQLRGSETTEHGTLRYAEGALFIQIHPKTKPGDYEVYGRYADESTFPADKRYWGSLKVVEPGTGKA
jgi:hypothetical protein